MTKKLQKLKGLTEVQLVGIIEAVEDHETLLVFESEGKELGGKYVLEVGNDIIKSLVRQLDPNQVDDFSIQNCFHQMVGHAKGSIQYLKIELLAAAADKFISRLYISFPRKVYQKSFSYQMSLVEGLIIALKSSSPIFLSDHLIEFLNQRDMNGELELDDLEESADLAMLLDQIHIESFGRYKM